MYKNVRSNKITHGIFTCSQRCGSDTLQKQHGCLKVNPYISVKVIIQYYIISRIQKKNDDKCIKMLGAVK